MEKYTIENEGGQRLDHYLMVVYPSFTRGEIIRSIKEGTITVNEKSQKQGYKLRAGDEVAVEKIDPTMDDALTPNEGLAKKLVIIEENDDFLVVEKRRGLQAHPSTTEKNKTLANAIVAYCPEIATVGDDPLRPGIMHRLDKYTSGLMVIAKNQATFESLKESFSSRDVAKTYHTLVWGHPKEDKTIEAPIARAMGYTRQKVVLNNSGSYKGEAKDAITEYKVKGFYHIDLPNNDGETPVAHIIAHPHTGRMHQIRVHMAHVAHPIVGDVKYEHKPHGLLNKAFFSRLPESGLHTFYLHAAELAFTLDGKEHTFTSDLPKYFKDALLLMREDR